MIEHRRDGNEVILSQCSPVVDNTIPFYVVGPFSVLLILYKGYSNSDLIIKASYQSKVGRYFYLNPQPKVDFLPPHFNGTFVYDIDDARSEYDVIVLQASLNYAPIIYIRNYVLNFVPPLHGFLTFQAQESGKAIDECVYSFLQHLPSKSYFIPSKSVKERILYANKTDINGVTAIEVMLGLTYIYSCILQCT